MDARRCGVGRPEPLFRDHLERWHHEKQAGYDREARRNRHQGEQKHDDAERARVQVVHQPTQRETVNRDLIVQPLQRDRGYNKRSGVTRRSARHRTDVLTSRLHYA
jgi:hypothetical protein